MSWILSLLVVVVVVSLAVIFLVNSKRERVVKIKKTFVVPANNVRARLKEQRKDEILDFIAKNGHITSRDTEKLVGVSSATATRYLQELTKEDRVVQKGKGRSVRYTL